MLHFRAFTLGHHQPSYCCYLVVLLHLAFHRAPFILNASFWVFFIHFYPGPSCCDFGLLVFPRASLFLVCCLGRSPHVSQTVVGWLHLWTGGKQAQDPPGSLHTIVSPVEWSSLKGRGPRWFTVRKTTGFTKMPPNCQSLAMWFHWCYCFLFSVLFGIALSLLSLHICPLMSFILAF